MGYSWDKREFTRVPVHMEVELRARLGGSRRGVGLNLSLGGLLVRCDDPPPVWTRCQVIMDISDGDRILQLSAVGQVLRRDAAGVAISFIDLPEASLPPLIDLLVRGGVEPERMITELTRRLTRPPLRLGEPAWC